MRRKEIAAKLDRIVEFAGVGPFIDMPVKWYSSGMFVRLGFAVAAHLEADILLVDEVLAVGDAAFQVRCYERIARAPAERRDAALHLARPVVDRAALRSRRADEPRPAGRRRHAGRRDRAVPAAGDRLVRGRRRRTRRHVRARRGARRERGLPRRGGAGGAGHDDRRAARRGRRHRRRHRRFDDAVVELFYYSRDGRTLHCQQSTAVSDEPSSTLHPGRRRIEFLVRGVRAAAGHLRRRRVDPRAPRRPARSTGGTERGCSTWSRANRCGATSTRPTNGGGPMPQPTLSIILPTYNRAALARDAPSRRCCGRPRPRRRTRSSSSTTTRATARRDAGRWVRRSAHPIDSRNRARACRTRGTRGSTPRARQSWPSPTTTSKWRPTGWRRSSRRSTRIPRWTASAAACCRPGSTRRPRWLTREHWAPLALQDHGDGRRIVRPAGADRI